LNHSEVLSFSERRILNTLGSSDTRSILLLRARINSSRIKATAELYEFMLL